MKEPESSVSEKDVRVAGRNLLMAEFLGPREEAFGV